MLQGKLSKRIREQIELSELFDLENELLLIAFEKEQAEKKRNREIKRARAREKARAKKAK